MHSDIPHGGFKHACTLRRDRNYLFSSVACEASHIHAKNLQSCLRESPLGLRSHGGITPSCDITRLAELPTFKDMLSVPTAVQLHGGQLRRCLQDVEITLRVVWSLTANLIFSGGLCRMYLWFMAMF